MSTEPMNPVSESELSPRGRNWMMVAIFVALIGIALSTYSTIHHLEVKATGSTDAACNINESFSCDSVAKSAYSEVFGIPLGVFGFGYFLAMMALAGISIINPNQRREHMHAYVLMVWIGVATAIGLAGISTFTLGTYCLMCIGVYITTALQAGFLLHFRREIPVGFSAGSLVNGGTTAFISVAAVVILFNFLAPTPSAKTADRDGTDSMAVQPLSAQVQSIPVNMSPYSGLGEDYRAGSDTAKVVLVEFADFECPACARMSETMRTLKKDYGDRILVVFRHYPLDQACNPSITRPMHKSACAIATLARCAGQFGKFWAYHDLAFDHQKEASPEKAKEWARSLNLTEEQISICQQDKSIVDKIREDIQLANTLGLTGTPTLFINGRKYLGDKGLPEIRQEIDKILTTN